MSPQLTLVHTLPLEKDDEAGSLMFGEASQSPLTIPKTLLAKMWGAVDQGVRLLPRGGAEVGGLLVGPKSREDGVVVDEIMPLSIEYKHGPSFRLSDSDLAKMAELIESVQSDPSKTVVGFYRSQTRKNETFRDSDREICGAIEKTHASFADNFRSYFVLAPVSRAEKLAHVSTWNGTDWDRTKFLLRSSILPAVPVPPPPAARAGFSAEASSVEAQPAAEPVFDFPEPQFVSQRKPGRRFYAGLGMMGGVLLISAVAYGGYRAYQGVLKNRPAAAATTTAVPPANVPPLRMEFSAAREGELWKLSWDRGTMAVLKPSSALLDIRDGASGQQIHLTPADLSSGTIFYTPRSGDLRFSMELELRDAAPMEEHVRILEGPPGASVSAESMPAVPSKSAPRVPKVLPVQGPPPAEADPELVP